MCTFFFFAFSTLAWALLLGLYGRYFYIVSKQKMSICGCGPEIACVCHNARVQGVSSAVSAGPHCSQSHTSASCLSVRCLCGLCKRVLKLRYTVTLLSEYSVECSL